MKYYTALSKGCPDTLLWGMTKKIRKKITEEGVLKKDITVQINSSMWRREGRKHRT